MNNDRVSKPNGIEIGDLDLIEESVANAVERRKSALESKGFISELSDNEAKLTKGGINGTDIIDICDLTTMGMISDPPYENKF